MSPTSKAGLPALWDLDLGSAPWGLWGEQNFHITAPGCGGETQAESSTRLSMSRQELIFSPFKASRKLHEPEGGGQEGWQAGDCPK